LQLHNEVFVSHQSISIEEYKVQAKRLEVKSCVTHEELPYTVGCRECHELFCVKCLAGLAQCSKGQSKNKVSMMSLKYCTFLLLGLG